MSGHQSCMALPKSGLSFITHTDDNYNHVYYDDLRSDLFNKDTIIVFEKYSFPTWPRIITCNRYIILHLNY